MKKFTFIFALFISTFSFAQKKASLQIDYSFIHIIDGYDHLVKSEIFIDGVLVATSKDHMESTPASVTIKTKRGPHKVKFVNHVFYEGKWEERTIANQYSTKGSFEVDMVFKKKNLITAIFDIDLSKPIVKM